jgi:hypothetical protein
LYFGGLLALPAFLGRGASSCPVLRFLGRALSVDLPFLLIFSGKKARRF